MKKFLTRNLPILTSPGRKIFTFPILLLSLLFLSQDAFAVTKTSTGTGNWSASGTWSPAGRPANGDNVIINSGDVVTIDSIFVCNNLNIGATGNADATLQITSSGKSLTINGDLQINPSDKNKTFILDAGPGTINISGTLSDWGAGSSGTNGIQVSTGTINITPAITLNDSKKYITFNGAGTITFNGAFTDQYNKLTTYTGCTANFKSSYIVNTTAADWASKGTAVFWNGSSITPTTAITLNNLQTYASASATLNSGSGAVIVSGTVTLASGSTFTTNKDFEVQGDWTDNGGVFIGTNDTLTLNSSSGIIAGTDTTSFRVLRIGRNLGSTIASITMNNNVTCNYLRISAGSAARTFTVASGKTLLVNNDVLVNQPTANSTTTSLSVGAGICNVTGNLNFLGTDATASRVGQVAVTSGTFTLGGSVTWMSNSSVATSAITVSTGTINFTSSLTMGSASGTLAVTSTGTINFNGSSAPSFTFGGATAPVFTTTNGCTLNFAKGFTNNTNALTLAATSQTNLTGTGTITPSSSITFGHLQVSAGTATLASGGSVVVAGNMTLASGSAFTANQDFEVMGDWTNNGGTFSGSTYTVTFRGSSKTIGGSASTTFGNLQIGRTSGSSEVSYTINTATTCTDLLITGTSYNRTLSLASGITLTVSDDVTIEQPDNPGVTSSLSVNAGICSIAGDLIFDGVAPIATRIAQVLVTSGSFTLIGNIQWMANTLVETEVITVSTGTINLGTSVTMGSASGTIAVTSTGTINFNGTSIPSLAFGGATAPVLTTTSGCTVRFEKGVTTVTTPLTFASGSNIYVGSPSSALNLTIDPGATVTNNGTTVVYGDLTSTSASTFVNGTNALLELRGGVSANVTLTATASGNTVNYKGGSAQTVKPTTYYNLTLDSASDKTCGTGVSVNNNLTVQGAATINNSVALTVAGSFIYSSSATSTLVNNITASGVTLTAGTLNDGGYTITVNNSTGWTNNGGTLTGTGTVAFTGSSASSIAGSTSTTFKNLTINNPAGVTLNLSPAAPTLVSGVLTLTSGVINSTSSNILKLTATASSSSGSASSYVSGPMVKVGNTDFTFPIGKSGKWMRAGVSGMTSAATEVSAEYFAVPYADIVTFDTSITQVSMIEYWDINRTVTADPVKIRLYWQNAAWSDIANCDLLTIAHFTEGHWIKEPATVTANSSCSWGWGGQGSIETNGMVSTFSPFGFGGGVGGGGLPVKLVSFDAIAVDFSQRVKTNWVTELEINNDYFTVERSTDGINFNEIARVEGAGNTTSLRTYESVDESPLLGTSYYRLRQTDFDGQFSYSDVVAVTIEGKQSGFTLYPNPAQGEFFVRVSNPSDIIELKIYDMIGREVYGRTIQSGENNSSQTIAVPTTDILPSGIYLVSVASNGTEFKEKVIVGPAQ